MGKKTDIQWTDSTVNPTKGCDGCELWNEYVKKCWAGGLTGRFGPTNSGLATDFDEVETAPDRMHEAAKWSDLTGQDRPKKPWLDGLPRMIFVGDMADNLSAEITFDYLMDEVIGAVTSEAGQRHHWQWLSKRPQRMAEFSKWLADRKITWPANLWAGTSVTTQATTSRVASLSEIGDERTIRFVSVEPQWESIDLGKYLPQLDWVIQGGHSGSHDHPFAMEWADQLRAQCREFSVSYHLKQLGSCVTVDGEKIRGHRGHGGDWGKWPRKLRVRQMPVYAGRRRLRNAKQRKA